jgi:hypothetical protein
MLIAFKSISNRNFRPLGHQKCEPPSSPHTPTEYIHHEYPVHLTSHPIHHSLFLINITHIHLYYCLEILSYLRISHWTKGGPGCCSGSMTRSRVQPEGLNAPMYIGPFKGHLYYSSGDKRISKGLHEAILARL